MLKVHSGRNLHSPLASHPRMTTAPAARYREHVIGTGPVPAAPVTVVNRLRSAVSNPHLIDVYQSLLTSARWSAGSLGNRKFDGRHGQRRRGLAHKKLLPALRAAVGL